MEVAVAGHRRVPGRIEGDLLATVKNVFTKLSVDYVYQGVAEGFDRLTARVAYENGIPYTAVYPYATTEYLNWSVGDPCSLSAENASEVVLLDPAIRYPGSHVFHAQNQFMVDNADEVLAYFNRNSAKSGTATTIKYAIKTGKPVHVIDPTTLEVAYAKY